MESFKYVFWVEESDLISLKGPWMCHVCSLLLASNSWSEYYVELSQIPSCNLYNVDIIGLYSLVIELNLMKNLTHWAQTVRVMKNLTSYHLSWFDINCLSRYHIKEDWGLIHVSQQSVVNVSSAPN